ncbi:MAG: hypothetical protein IH921_01450, partial [Gemmatimonadetes bacterium]|nr:hypothetical protein [Gemmatimonadota bacterium]
MLCGIANYHLSADGEKLVYRAGDEYGVVDVAKKAEVGDGKVSLENVRIVRADTPEDGGTYGVATRRFSYMGYGGSPDYVQALRDIVVVIMIEKRGTVENLEEVLSVEGVDMIQWGGADYSMSVGMAGKRGAPEIKAAERRVFETAIKMGVPPRAELGSADQAKYYLDLG